MIIQQMRSKEQHRHQIFKHAQKKGESNKYATLTLKGTILDKGGIILPSWIEE
jgi:hypothetical protein